MCFKPIKMNRKYCLCTTNGSNGNRIYPTTRFRVSYPVICIRSKWCTAMMYHRDCIINANCSTYLYKCETDEGGTRVIILEPWFPQFRSKCSHWLTWHFETYHVMNYAPQGSPLLYNCVVKLIFRRFVKLFFCISYLKI